MSVSRSRIPGALAILALLLATPLAAQQKEPFTPERFSALQEEGALILVDVFADWCPTCALQQKVLEGFRQENPAVPLHTLTVDFDSQKEWVRHFEAPRQSTLILYRGTERVWFSVAETRAEVIVGELLRAASGG